MTFPDYRPLDGPFDTIIYLWYFVDGSYKLFLIIVHSPWLQYLKTLKNRIIWFSIYCLTT